MTSDGARRQYVDRKLIFLELNEVPYPILEYYRAERPKSALARKLDRCRQYVTESPDTENLSPWTT